MTLPPKTSEDCIAGLPGHPQPGLGTVTCMTAGRMRQRDGAGHGGLRANGGVPWMHAGRH